MLHRGKSQVSAFLAALGFFFVIFSCTPSYAQTHGVSGGYPVLIVSSYNPSSSTSSGTISDFQKACDSLSIKREFILESLNCKSFAESSTWVKKLSMIMNRFLDSDGGIRLSAIVLIGQESLAAYIGLPDNLKGDVPVVVGNVSENMIMLPTDPSQTKTWMPDPLYPSDLHGLKSPMLGIVYNYDVEKNIELALSYYPKARNFALITCNSLEGVCLQAHVRKAFRSYKKLNLILLDGREKNERAMFNCIRMLQDSTVILAGTWKIDQDERFYLATSIYSLLEANPRLPVFSITSSALGHRAIGGYVPADKAQGEKLAFDLYKVLEGQYPEPGIFLEKIDNETCLDENVLATLGFSKKFGKDVVYINREVSYLRRHPNIAAFLFVSILSLLLISFIVTYMLLRTRKLNKSLSVSQRDNRLILNNIGVGLVFVDKDYNLRWENCSVIAGMENFSDIQVNQKCFNLKMCHKDCKSACPLSKFEKQSLAEPENFILRLDKESFDISYNPMYNGEFYTGSIIKIENITAREQINAELIAAKNAAEKADSIKSAFIANMSHEIRTPLNAINGFSELLMDEDTARDDRKMYMDIIRSNIRQLLTLVNDILSLSKIESGVIDFNMVEMDLNKFMTSVYSEYAKDAKARINDFADKDVKMLLDIPETSAVVFCDNTRLKEVFTNLINNAIKYTMKGHIKIGYSVSVEEGMVHCYVEDTGKGIPIEKQAMIFDRFVKLNDYVKGTGLGLSICKTIVGCIKGNIGVDSEPGKGSTFWFTFPING